MGPREQRLAAVAARLEQVAAAQDLSPVLEPGALTEARRLTEILRDDDGDMQTRYVLGWLHWYRYQALPEGQDRQDLNAAIDMFTPCFIVGVEGLPKPLLPVLAEQAVPVATVIHQEVLGSANRDLIPTDVDLWQRILDATPTDDPDRAGRMSNLGTSLAIRFEHSRALADLDAAIQAIQAAVAATPDGHPNQDERLSNLGRVLVTRFEHTRALADLDAAIQAIQAAVAATPADHRNRAFHLDNLATTLATRFEHTGAQADQDAAINAGRAAAEATPADHPDRAGRINSLGSLLRARFQRTAALADLDAAIAAFQAALQATPNGHPDWAQYLNNLGSTLEVRFEHTGALADLDAAIEDLEAAVAATPVGHPNRALRLSNLGGALQARFGRTGTLADLDAAIEAGRAAVTAAPADHPDRARYVSNLGNALQARFERTGTLADLDAAVKALEEAAAATPAGHLNRAPTLSNLGDALRARFERTGTLADLDAAIEALDTAAQDTLAGEPDRAVILSSLGAGLVTRFRRTGARADLDAAIEVGRAAVQATPAGDRRATSLNILGAALLTRFGRDGAQADLDAAIEAIATAVQATGSRPDRVQYLNGLGNALLTRFERTDALADLDAGIAALEAAVTAAPADWPVRTWMLSNLGTSLRTRFERSGTLADLEAAIEAGRAAEAAAPADHPGRTIVLYNLGASLLTRFDHTGVMADLDAAIEADRAAVTATPADHPDQAKFLGNLGMALRTRFRRTGAQADLDAAISVYTQAFEVGTAAASIRVRAARTAAGLAAQTEPGRAADLLGNAVRLLPEVTPRQLGRSDQQYAIGGFAGLAADAAALALADPGTTNVKSATRALRLLEEGRAVLLSQALDTRSDLSDLRHQHPELAARFTELRTQLDQPEDLSQPVTSPDPSPDPPGRAAETRRRLAGAFAAVLEQIRTLDGFASFGLPPSTGELLAEAASGPVVTFNISVYRSDALLLTGDGITSLELPGLSYETLAGQIDSFHKARRTAAHPGAGIANRIGAQDKLLEILGWLWDTAAGPVLDALGFDQPPPSGAVWPRIWWAPGGLLSLLPIHAAGHHTEPLTGDQARRTVMDRVISSWTPTIRALRYARQHAPSLPAGRALIVAMPVTPGLPGGGELPNVPEEVARVRALLPDTVLLAEPGDQRASGSSEIPTRKNVLGQLPGCAIAHFACHGFSDPADPSKSLLLLHDHDNAPLTVASLAPVDLGQAELAYLSACDTALTSTAGLIDEAIHLTTAFQLAGFPHVIGTLWEINDELAVTIADTFYTDLRTSPSTLETGQAARALHKAVRAARDQLPRTPSLWAAYLHAGT
jgi:tetratricopeptide (TPR) repeat protein